MTISSRDQRLIWHPYSQLKLEGPPLGVMSAKGTLLHLEDGRTLIDAVSSWWVNLHGHSHPHISERINQQLEKLHHVIFAGFSHEPAVELAERLEKLVPLKNIKVFFSDDGSTAVEAALKMAIQYWHNNGKSKKKILAFEGAYHGDTFGAMSVSARSVYNQPFQQHLFEVEYIRRPDFGCEQESIAQFKDTIAGGDVAAFIFEPLIQGAAGMQIYSREALDVMLGLCRQENVIAIADEVFTAFGRTGKLFACEYLNNCPDIFCMSKGITGGSLPLGVTVAADWIYEAFNSGERSRMLLHGHSYTANPIACAAANASLELLEQTECTEHVKRIEQSHRDFLPKLTAHGKASSVRSLGTILVFDYVSKNSTGYLNPLRDKLYKYFIEQGVLIRPLGNVVYLVPPYCVSESQLAKVYQVILKSLDCDF